MIERALASKSPSSHQSHVINTARTVAVATDYFWTEIDDTTPCGAKLQLLGEGGVAIYGVHSRREKFFTHWAPIPTHMPRCPVNFRPGKQGFRLSHGSNVVVAEDYYWTPIGSDTPIGVKLQLLGLGGVAIYGVHRPKETFFTHWAPLPKKRDR